MFAITSARFFEFNQVWTLREVDHHCYNTIYSVADLNGERIEIECSPQPLSAALDYVLSMRGADDWVDVLLLNGRRIRNIHMAKLDDVVVISDEDRQGYLDELGEYISAGAIAKDITVSWIYQLFDMGGAYIGAVLVVDSTEIIRKSSGAEPSFRKWLVIDPSWNSALFDSVGDYYRHIAKQLLSPMQQRVYKFDQFYLNKALAYEKIVNQGTMDVSRYAESK